MKAVVYTEFGPPEVLRVADVPTPAPKEDEVLVRVHATSVAYGDMLARNFKDVSGREFNMPLPLLLPQRMVFGFRRPKVTILGSEFSGEVAAAGRQVTRFKAGDQVYGYLGQRMGAYAEYVCISETGVLALKPANLTHEQAAAVPYGAIMATSLLRRANIQPGHKVLINGASGGIGSAAVQLARYYGAEVTGVCGAPRMEYVRSLGADRVIDYAREDFTRDGETYDLIFDVLGKRSFPQVRGSLKPDGVYLLASFKTRHLLQMLRTKMTGSQKVICALASEKPEDLEFVRELVEAGQFKSIVDRVFPLEQAAEAHRYVESGSRQGAVVITVGKDANFSEKLASL
jgi:NADPH:quinone reductase-like Zn-dependent oxidoreductase